MIFKLNDSPATSDTWPGPIIPVDRNIYRNYEEELCFINDEGNEALIKYYDNYFETKYDSRITTGFCDSDEDPRGIYPEGASLVIMKVKEAIESGLLELQED